MADSMTVTFTLTGLERVGGRGRLVGLAIVEAEIAGVALTLQGVQILREGDGGLTVRAPSFRRPHDGRWLPAIILPPELSEAIAREVLAAWSDRLH